jgi:hypothetical protein
MRRREVVFIVAVLGMAAVFVALTLSSAWETVGKPAAVEFGSRGAAGIPREVDVERVRRLIEGGGLSDREAEFYREAEEPPSAKAAY